MKRLLLLATLLLAGTAVAQDEGSPPRGARIPPSTGPKHERPYSPVTNELLLDPGPGDWLQWRRTVDNWGYSPLSQINRQNVRDLELAWVWPVPVDGNQGMAPLVHDGIMFLAGNQNEVEAVNAVTGDLIWSYVYRLPPGNDRFIAGQAARQKHSAVLYGKNLIMTTADAKLVALDALTGKVAWQVQVHDWKHGYSYTAGPLVAAGKIFVGSSGCSVVSSTGACWITAHDANTGRELWRFNVLDDPNNPLVAASWKNIPPEKRSGGSMWGGGAYDPKLNLVYFGTGMPTPYTEVARGTGDGDVLYTNTVLALNADTGKLVWYYQHFPRDNWDMDSPFEWQVIDTMIDGKMRNLLVSTPGKSGITFALDRATGKFVWAKDTVYQNMVSRIDPVTGRVTINPAVIPVDEKPVLACPGFAGGRSWPASAYSPKTGLFYIEGANYCFTTAVSKEPPDPDRTGNVVTGGALFGPFEVREGAKSLGSLFAMDVKTGRKAYELSPKWRLNSSILTTAGGVMFIGDTARYLRAYNDKTGQEIWNVRLGAPIGGAPMTYEVDGVQYIALPTGPSVRTHAWLQPGIGNPRGAGSAVYVFRLKRK